MRTCSDQRCTSKLGIKDDGSTFVNVIRRSIDARSKHVIVRMQCEIVPFSERKPLITYTKNFPDVSRSKAVVIVGQRACGFVRGFKAD